MVYDAGLDLQLLTTHVQLKLTGSPPVQRSAAQTLGPPNQTQKFHSRANRRTNNKPNKPNKHLRVNAIHLIDRFVAGGHLEFAPNLQPHATIYICTLLSAPTPSSHVSAPRLSPSPSPPGHQLKPPAQSPDHTLCATLAHQAMCHKHAPRAMNENNEGHHQRGCFVPSSVLMVSGRQVP